MNRLAVHLALLGGLLLWLAVGDAVHAQTPSIASDVPAASQPIPLPTRAQIDAAIDRGVKFLVADQAPKGNWGTGCITTGDEITDMVPGSMVSFRLATTALCVMALREAGEKSAHDRGLEYLLTAEDARRDDGELIYNTWAHIFVTQCMAEELLHAKTRDPRIVAVAQRNIKHLQEYATYIGGWDYYDFAAHTKQVSLGPTSFGTGAGLTALWEARQAGLDVPQRLVDLSLHRLEEMRVSDGAFLYGTDYQYIPLLPANLPRGAFGRTQPAHLGIRLWDPAHATNDQLCTGLDAFFKNHDFINMGRKRPIPHESWYQTSGYYYYYDHYYASRLFEFLTEAQRARYQIPLAGCIVPHQEPDGSWWDFAIYDFSKPYGTALAVMTLLRCR